jgi:hypothetical protein
MSKKTLREEIASACSVATAQQTPVFVRIEIPPGKTPESVIGEILSELTSPPELVEDGFYDSPGNAGVTEEGE